MTGPSIPQGPSGDTKYTKKKLAILSDCTDRNACGMSCMPSCHRSNPAYHSSPSSSVTNWLSFVDQHQALFASEIIYLYQVPLVLYTHPLILFNSPRATTHTHTHAHTSLSEFLKALEMAREQTGTRRRRSGSANQASSTSGGGAPARQAANTGTDTGGNTTATPSMRDAFRQAFMRALMMYLLYNYYIKPKQKKPEEVEIIDTAVQTAPAGKGVSNPLLGMFGMETGPVPGYYKVSLNNAWRIGEPVQMRVYESLERDMSFREALRKDKDDALWSADGLSYDMNGGNYLAKNFTLQVPAVVWETNCSWHAHVFVTSGNMFERNVDEVSDEMIEKNVLYARHDFISWIDVDLSKKGKSLLGADDEKDDGDMVESAEKSEEGWSGKEESGKDEETEVRIRHEQVWRPSMEIVLVNAKDMLLLSQLPPPASREFRVSTKSRVYYPPMGVHNFWVLQDMLKAMNDSVKEIQVEMTFAPMSLTKWSIYKQFDNIWEKQIDMGAMRVGERDELKRMFVETNPVLLGTTMVVSFAHSILEALAFKNDVAHWKSIKSMEGISVRSMIWKIVMEAIIFLYLWDNETSWMITIGNGIGVAIAVWKLGKAVKFENFGRRKLFGLIPWFDMTDRESYSKETKEYDEQAMRYLGYLVYPLVLCYAGYSLKYEKHKSWYSWVINSLVGAVYAFGFIMMFPQIFINYKLKSVAHMPMKAMMYKTLNTVIDDLFSFIIKMPWLHRLACFRDDVVFVIFLYQRWIYPVDKTRVNEFGQGFEEREEEVEKEESESTEIESKTEGEKKND